MLRSLTPVGGLAALLPIAASLAGEPCRIEIVEQGSNWPVPLVELRTTHQLRFVSDNAGIIAFDAPELMGRETWCEVLGHGYSVAPDGFGYRGVRLTPEPGKTVRVEVQRLIIARRIGRLTGAGLFGESQQLGLARDWKESGVVGCDSVQNAVHRGQLFWFWGDTTLARYPLGIFDGTGATTPVSPLPSLEPPLRLRLDYFTDTNAAPRGIAPMRGAGPTWVTGVASLPDRRGMAQLVCAYMKVKPPMDVYEWGLAVWNEDGKVFESLKTVWTKSAEAPRPSPIPEGHPVKWKDSSGTEWLLFGNPFPTLRCLASFEAWQDPKQWEVLKPDATLRAAESEGTVKPHSGSIAWNSWRKKWVTVFMESFGKPSALGELWYAEADQPTGPWGPAVKVLSHENYTFYNPRIHPEFTPKGSPALFFEGTYTMQFADKPAPTPRYDYNQILYRLDLDDPQLKPARQ